MKIVLRVIACFVAVAVTQTAFTVGQFALQGALSPLVSAGVIGPMTIAAWLIILTVGPVAAIQLWRLRRIGLFVAATLCGIALSYYVIGISFLKHPEAPLTPIVIPIVFNGLFLALLLSSAARQAVS